MAAIHMDHIADMNGAGRLCVIELRKIDNTKKPPITETACINPGSVTYDGVKPNEAASLFFKEIQLDLLKMKDILCSAPKGAPK